MDYRKLKIDSDTKLGKITYIWGVNKDDIVFYDENSSLKYLSARKDKVYAKAVEIANKLSSKAIKKLNVVRYGEVNDHIASCVAQAFKPGVKQNQVKKLFKPASDFINSIKKIKNVIARGPNPQHIVFIDKDNQVGSEVLNPPDHISEAMSQLTRISQLNFSLLPKYLRLGVATSIGSSYAAVIRSSSSDNLNSYIVEAENHLNQAVKDWHYSLYTFSSFAIFSLFSIAMYLSISPLPQIVIGILGGSLGATFSSLQRTSSSNFTLYETGLSIVMQSISRIFFGMVAGVVVVMLKESNIALGIIGDNAYSTFLFGVAFGFSERVVPDTLSSLSKKNKI